MEEEKKIVTNFSAKMLEKIQRRHNRYSPLGWKTMDMKRLVWLLEGELRELKESNSRKNRMDECIDVANYAMFIYELSKNK